MESEKINRLLLVSFIVIISALAGALGVIYLSPYVKSNDQMSQQEFLRQFNDKLQANDPKLSTVIKLIKNNYIDLVDVDTLSESIIPELLKKLDPHTSYIPAKEVLGANENLEGNFDGIGIMFNMVTDTLIILEVIPGGPSSKVGLQNGDKIIKVDDKNIAGVKYDQNEVVKLLKGPGGTPVKVSVERTGFKDLIDIVIIRGKVLIASVDAALMLKPGIGYLKLLRFAKNTHTEFIAAVDSLRSLGMKTLILDLKGNGGGFMDQAMMLSNEFLPKNDLIVYTENKTGITAEQRASGTGRYIDQNLYVLVDEFSASSSEIVAGALQDNDRATLVGRRSYGKGLIQQHIPLADGSILSLTIARYHTPSGRSVQRHYDYGGSEKYRGDIYDRHTSGEMLNADSIKIADSLKYYTKGGRVVYGGGGILPDIFVPLDTMTRYSQSVKRALSSLDLIKFVTKYTSNHRKEMDKMDTIEKINQYFAKNQDRVYDDYVAFLNQSSVKITTQEKVRYKKEIMPFLRAYIAQYSPVGSSAFYFMIYPFDEIISKAVSEIESKNKNQLK